MNYFLIQYIFNHIDVALIVKDKLFNDKFAVLYQYDFVVYKMNMKLYFSFILIVITWVQTAMFKYV